MFQPDAKETVMNRKLRTVTAVAAGSQPSAMFRRARALAVALAASALLLFPAAAYAVDNNPDPGVRCAAKVGPGEYEFYLPGAKVTDKDGNKWVCGPDGMWFRDYSAIRIVRAPVYQVLASAAFIR
jgi:hypothetical protein